MPHADVPDHGFVDPLPFAIDFDYGYDAILRSHEFSLARLGLNRIDLLYVHDLEVRSWGKENYDRHLRSFLDGGLKALEELKRGNVIKAFGLGVNDTEVCLDVMSRAPMDCILLAGRFTLLDRMAKRELIPLCKNNATIIVAGGVFNSGILATGPTPDAHYNYAPPSTDIVRRVSEMQSVAIDVSVR